MSFLSLGCDKRLTTTKGAKEMKLICRTKCKGSNDSPLGFGETSCRFPFAKQVITESESFSSAVQDFSTPLRSQ